MRATAAVALKRKPKRVLGRGSSARKQVGGGRGVGGRGEGKPLEGEREGEAAGC